ncbi:MAG: LegC family aminotransferase [Alphaproteobacteria bacterium]|nr:MAG: LegC family aminotransferase [Alphaproteobacteria bacterium]
MYDDIIQFIRKLYGETGEVFLHEPVFRGAEKDYLIRTIDSTFVSSVGEYVTRFGEEFAQFVGAKHAVPVTNGTAALHVACLAAGVKPGDEVITQPLTFVATCNAISYCGAKPVFVDVERDTLGLSPTALQSFLETQTRQENGVCVNRRTGKVIRAVVPMHVFGHPVRIREIADICTEHHIVLVEDAAEALGSFVDGRHVGTFGMVSAFSFNGNKIITTGGGGMVVTDDDNVADWVRHITTTAKLPHAWNYAHDSIAFNYRMPNLNAALGCAQLEQLPRFLASHRATAAAYRDFFANRNDATFVDEPSGCKSNFWLNAIMLGNRTERDAFLEATHGNAVMTRPIWNLMNRLPMYAGCQNDGLKVAQWLEDRVVNLPSTARDVA